MSPGRRAVSVALACVACNGGDARSSATDAGNTGDSAMQSGSTGTSNSSQDAASDETGTGGSSSSNNGDDSAGTTSTAGSSAGSPEDDRFTVPQASIGGPCDATATAAPEPCRAGRTPDQSYCSLDDPTQIIMAVCNTAGRSQCDVMDGCGAGWHACTATDYLARGGRDVAPDFSNTNRAWLAACVRDVNGDELRNEACSQCGVNPAYPPSVMWYCDGSVVHAAGMDGDALGVLTSPTCFRVGENLPDHSAYWAISFADGAPTFVMCCADAI